MPTPSASPQHRVPTVNDLRVKLCYICREEEQYDDPQQSPARPWTHPCKCTLVAHEACLLKWIQTAQANASRAPNALKCPQCGAQYDLVSKDTWLLKALRTGNKALERAGVLFSVFGVATVVGVVGTSIYVLYTSYGAWALRTFIGKEMFDILLTDDPSNWPVVAFLKLPLLAHYILFSRFPSIARRTGGMHFIPLLLIWPPSSPFVFNRIDGPSSSSISPSTPLPSPSSSSASSSAYSPTSIVAPHTPESTSWPPSPIMFSLFVFPVVRMMYRAGYEKVYYAVMGTLPPSPARDNRNRRGANNAAPGGNGNAAAGNGGGDLNFGDGAFVLRFRANVDGGEVAPPPPVDAQNPNPNPNDNNNNNNNPPADGANLDAAAAAETLIEVHSLGRKLGGALLSPLISSFMGSLLFRLAKNSYWLRGFLGVKPYHYFPTTGSGMRGVMGINASARAGITKWEWEKMGLVKRVGMTLRLIMGGIWGGNQVWADRDPVWWRNSIGLGLFVVAKDAIELLHLYLAKRELESRHVMNKNFAGVDLRELDLVPGFPVQQQQ